MNRILRTTALSILFVAAALFSHAQGKSIYTEEVQIHLNSDFLLTGETLYCAVHCFNNETGKYSTLSKLAYVELIGENERPFLQIKIPLSGGLGAGDFFLPSTLPSGHYTLIAYTKWMRNFAIDDFFQRQITVINPYLKPIPAGAQGQGEKFVAAKNHQMIKKESRAIQLESDQKNYSPRQKVSVKIKNTDSSNDLHISFNVHKLESTPAKSDSSSHRQPEHPQKFPAKEFISLLPDLRGETIGGTVKETSSGRAVPNSIVYLSIPGSSSVFQISQTDSSGRFYFSAKNIHTANGIQFQVDQNSGVVDVVLDDEFVNDYRKFKPQPLRIDTSMRRQIEQRNLYSQIENAYFIKKRDSVLDSPQAFFFDMPDKVYRLDDFTRFPTMEDIFREYMYEVAVSKREGKFILRLLNSTTKNGARFVNAPLVLMDGIPIFDTEVLMSYNPLLIETVSFITRPYIYGGVLYDGILSAHTYIGNAKELDVKPIRKEFTSWQYPKKYYTPVYSKPESLVRVPDYRVQLFWNPAITISPSQELIIEFYSSDVEGMFLMQAQGFNSNGDVINLSQTIKVQK